MESGIENPEVDRTATATAAGDAAFWGAGSYRSGGVDWREFLDIDDADETASTESAETRPADTAAQDGAGVAAPPVAATAVELASRRGELTELAAPSWPPDEPDEGFGSWSTSPDDLLPFR